MSSEKEKKALYVQAINSLNIFEKELTNLGGKGEARLIGMHKASIFLNESMYRFYRIQNDGDINFNKVIGTIQNVNDQLNREYKSDVSDEELQELSLLVKRITDQLPNDYDKSQLKKVVEDFKTE